MAESSLATPSGEAMRAGTSVSYRILRYTPNIVRDEWVNIGVLVYDERTGERRLRLIEEEEEYRRVRRLHLGADESLLRVLRDNLESRLETGGVGNGSPPGSGGATQWLNVLAKWDSTLSNVLQLTPPRAVLNSDLDTEVERLYADHVAVPRAGARAGVAGSRSSVRSYCAQVFRQARLWERLEKSVRVSDYTFPGDPMRLDYSYRRNGTRGFVQALSVTRAPRDAKELAYTAAHIQAKAKFASEFTVVTDIPLTQENERHAFVRDTLRETGIEPVPVEGFAVWVAKLRPMLQ